VTAWDLQNSVYLQVADVSNADEYAASLPFPVLVRPADLVAD
jgi:hypothetical protein